jgi:hypothetical protein
MDDSGTMTMPSTAPTRVALCVALLVVCSSAVGRFVANHLLRSVRIP